jgi:hypothetical protein
MLPSARFSLNGVRPTYLAHARTSATATSGQSSACGPICRGGFRATHSQTRSSFVINLYWQSKRRLTSGCTGAGAAEASSIVQCRCAGPVNLGVGRRHEGTGDHLLIHGAGLGPMLGQGTALAKRYERIPWGASRTAASLAAWALSLGLRTMRGGQHDCGRRPTSGCTGAGAHMCSWFIECRRAGPVNLIVRLAALRKGRMRP